MTRTEKTWSVGSGEPVLLFPYPHGHTTEPMAQSPLAKILAGMGRAGRGNLALHKRLQNLMERVSYCDKSFFTPVEVDADDYKKGVPVRTIWTKNMYTGLSYANRLGEVRASTLIMAG